MVPQFFFGGWATCHQVGWQIGLIMLVIGGACCGSILGPGVSRPGSIGTPEYATAALVCTFIALHLALFVYTNVFNVWEARFWDMPWSDSKPTADGKPGRRSSIFAGQSCPFTGMQPTLRCPSCKAAVHESAFHEEEKKVDFIVGESILRWDVATAALDKKDTPAQSRVELDEALDFAGNMFFGAIGNCCIGCAAWQRSFNLMARWSLSCAAFSIVFVVAPWGFQSSLQTVNHGKSLQWLMLVYAILFCCYAWATEVKRLALAVAFMSRFQNKIPFPAPITAPLAGWKRNLLAFAAGKDAWQHVPDP